MDKDNVELHRRLANLHTQSYKDLIRVAIRLTKSQTDAEELVCDLYEYLLNRGTQKLYWGSDTFNILYCNKFIHSRFINKVKRGKKLQSITGLEMVDEEYDIGYDESIEEAHKEVIDELKRLERTKMWAPAKIFQLYMMSDKTLDEVAGAIGISKSTTFLSVKKIRQHLKEQIQNPFGQEE
jgi:DNA-directed RNA polymerase specialized sigma24 family protein